MSKPIYRTRFTTKTGAYRVREFRSQKNAETHAKQLANEGAYGYVERTTAVSTSVVSNWGWGTPETPAA
ncbi:hypothetical protein [Burkholderia ubonensis]|uniref:hypothetical protein n=1 Tax=Burkholderia ubonensis TaxID=101571 RepID=UPI0007538988|nr:hypothetical protein [Burkholderia ubonensis]KVZ62245.1 hypothetical protein WL19_30150 [Burkholderia ubonensis]